MAKAKSGLVVSESGQLTDQRVAVRKIRSQFLKTNNEIVSIVERQQDLHEDLKELGIKKKELCKSVSLNIKDAKTELKQLQETLIFQLGERSGFLKNLNQFGVSLDEKQTEGIPKQISSKLIKQKV